MILQKKLWIFYLIAFSFRQVRMFQTKFQKTHDRFGPLMTSKNFNENAERKELWKSISKLEREAVDLLTQNDPDKVDEGFKLLAKSLKLKKNDPLIALSDAYNNAIEMNNVFESEKIFLELKSSGLPPHIAELVSRKRNQLAQVTSAFPGSTFSDTVTEKVRVKVSSFFDTEKSSPANGRYMFYYKVGIYNEGSEPVQVVGRMWEIEKCEGEKEVIRGSGIMNTQPIIPPGDVFTYQSTCPLKLFPPKGKRILASMSGAYTMCKGNMGQHNFSAKVGKFNLILPETALSPSR
jgi:ApaG protein